MITGFSSLASQTSKTDSQTSKAYGNSVPVKLSGEYCNRILDFSNLYS